MSTNRDFDRIASGWLAEGPTELNDRVLDAALDEVHLTHQRRRPAVPWRNLFMTMPIRLAAAVAIVAILGFAGLTFLGKPGPGSSVPAATCTSAPAPNVTPQPGATPLDRARWKTYVSTQFGFSICYPADWVVRTGDMPPDPSHPAYAGLDPAREHFVAPDESIFLSAWSIVVAPGTTLDSVVQATCVADQITCPSWQAHATPVTVDGHAGYVALLGTCTNQACDTGFTEAYLLVDNRLYRVTSGRAPGEYDSDRLLRTFFSTMHLLPGGPVPASTAAPS
jgi:hypothetical protein